MSSAVHKFSLCVHSVNGWKSLASAMLNKKWKPRVPTKSDGLQWICSMDLFRSWVIYFVPRAQVTVFYCIDLSSTVVVCLMLGQFAIGAAWSGSW